MNTNVAEEHTPNTLTKLWHPRAKPERDSTFPRRPYSASDQYA